MANINKIGSFQILSTLGHGAHSSILHIRRAEDSREYALKMVPIEKKDDLKYLEQARHEFRVGQMLNHPNLIRVYCLEEKKNLFFQVKKAHLLIEFVNGKPLDQNLIPLKDLMLVFAKVAAGLMHMHRKNVFHADLKPNNIMIGKRGEVKVIDFGLAHIADEPKDRVQGTPEYMAPETGRHKTVNERSDMYNFGATMYRMVTQKLPPAAFDPTGQVKITSKMWQKDYVPIKELNKGASPELSELIEKCLSFDADNRPERMGEIVMKLKSICESLDIPVDDVE